MRQFSIDKKRSPSAQTVPDVVMDGIPGLNRGSGWAMTTVGGNPPNLNGLTALVSADNRQDFARNVARHRWRGEEDIGRGNLLGLGGPSNLRLAAKAFNPPGGFICGVERRPSGPGATTLTRMPRGMRCADSDRAKA